MSAMEAAELRRKFLSFFGARGHKVVDSSSLIPPSADGVLLTTAGMQQFKKYYTGEADPVKDFGTKNTASIQKSFRTSDIDEVGNESHNTFFEMLGNFSFGGYFKKEAITYAYDFITKELGLPISYVTVFRGEQGVAKDEESREIWKSLGVSDVREEGMENVFWGPTGSSGPCGPTTEIYCQNAGGKDIEVWNIVFNEFFCEGSREDLLVGRAKLTPLRQKGIDTGLGLERLAMISQKTQNIFETDLFAPLLELLPKEVDIRHKRIIVDHLRGSTFLLADGVRPSNKEAGYILRRLMRRAFVYEKIYDIPSHVFDAIIHDIVHEYGEFYSELMRENENIREEFKNEREKFSKTISGGLKILNREMRAQTMGRGGTYDVQDFSSVNNFPGFTPLIITGKWLFDFYQSFGFPPELTLEVIEKTLNRRFVDFERENLMKEFGDELKKHQEISRAGQERKFGGHGLLLDTGELKAANEEELKIVTRLHTATHLLNAALHKVLGSEVEQRGSDITVERTRFDFLFSRKLTLEEIKKIEDLVNYAVQKDFPVTIQEMEVEDAQKSGALFFYKGVYPKRVKVYTVGDESETFSQELCGGPHVTHTGEIGKFRIVKEESSSAGIRRIRAVAEQ